MKKIALIVLFVLIAFTAFAGKVDFDLGLGATYDVSEREATIGPECRIGYSFFDADFAFQMGLHSNYNITSTVGVRFDAFDHFRFGLGLGMKAYHEDNAFVNEFNGKNFKYSAKNLEAMIIQVIGNSPFIARATVDYLAEDYTIGFSATLNTPFTIRYTRAQDLLKIFKDDFIGMLYKGIQVGIFANYKF